MIALDHVGIPRVVGCVIRFRRGDLLDREQPLIKVVVASLNPTLRLCLTDLPGAKKPIRAILVILMLYHARGKRTDVRPPLAMVPEIDTPCSEIF